MALTPVRLRELLDYNPETGEFRWRVDRGSRVRAGSLAGCVNHWGYLVIRLDGERYQAHRLAWLYVHGEWPPNLIDHINLNRADNPIANLRLATMSENQANRPAARNNTCGIKGVRARGNRWHAHIGHNGKVSYLGSFKTPELARAAYELAAREKFKEFARCE